MVAWRSWGLCRSRLGRLGLWVGTVVWPFWLKRASNTVALGLLLFSRILVVGLQMNVCSVRAHKSNSQEFDEILLDL